MENNWQCKFKNPPKQITVGQKLLMLCEGESKTTFKRPVHIEFVNNKDNYSLHILKTLNKDDYFLALEVTSYRTGTFQSPFIITDGEQSLIIKDLSFSVQSVLKAEQKQAKAHGPFGPFKPPLPLWYFATMIFVLSCLCACIFIFLNRLFKRRKFIQKILNRKPDLSPSKSFILGLRKQKTDSIPPVKNLEQLFKVFLEDLFFIPAVGQTREQIMKHLKKYQYPAFKREGQALRQILNELSLLSQASTDKKTFLKLKTACQKMVFFLDSKRK